MFFYREGREKFVRLKGTPERQERRVAHVICLLISSLCGA
jgi:hypothetical protein